VVKIIEEKKVIQMQNFKELGLELKKILINKRHYGRDSLFE